jgi:F-box interacting protein
LSTKRHHLITTRWKWNLSKELAIISHPLDSIPLHSILTSKGTQLDFSPIIIQWYWEGLIGSCDGLLCFVVNKRAFLYNPCIRKAKELPSLEISPEIYNALGYAFGYDPFIDNYIVICYFCSDVQYNDCKGQVKVHTLGTDSWRRIKDSPSKLLYRERGIFLSGTVNWLAYYNTNDFNYLTVIVSLHLGKESFQEIPTPEYGNINNVLNFSVMRDCLCIFSRHYLESSTDVWLMKEYGNKDSWIKLICLPYFGDSSGVFTRILYISEDNNHVLLVFKELGKSKWVVYDCKNDIITSSKIEELSLVESNVYVESLISP